MDRKMIEEKVRNDHENIRILQQMRDTLSMLPAGRTVSFYTVYEPVLLGYLRKLLYECRIFRHNKIAFRRVLIEFDAVLQNFEVFQDSHKMSKKIIEYCLKIVQTCFSSIFTGYYDNFKRFRKIFVANMSNKKNQTNEDDLACFFMGLFKKNELDTDDVKNNNILLENTALEELNHGLDFQESNIIKNDELSLTETTMNEGVLKSLNFQSFLNDFNNLRESTDLYENNDEKTCGLKKNNRSKRSGIHEKNAIGRNHSPINFLATGIIQNREHMESTQQLEIRISGENANSNIETSNENQNINNSTLLRYSNQNFTSFDDSLAQLNQGYSYGDISTTEHNEISTDNFNQHSRSNTDEHCTEFELNSFQNVPLHSSVQNISNISSLEHGNDLVDRQSPSQNHFQVNETASRSNITESTFMDNNSIQINTGSGHNINQIYRRESNLTEFSNINPNQNSNLAGLQTLIPSSDHSMSQLTPESVHRTVSSQILQNDNFFYTHDQNFSSGFLGTEINNQNEIRRENNIRSQQETSSAQEGTQINLDFSRILSSVNLLEQMNTLPQESETLSENTPIFHDYTNSETSCDFYTSDNLETFDERSTDTLHPSILDFSFHDNLDDEFSNITSENLHIGYLNDSISFDSLNNMQEEQSVTPSNISTLSNDYSTFFRFPITSLPNFDRITYLNETSPLIISYPRNRGDNTPIPNDYSLTNSQSSILTQNISFPATNDSVEVNINNTLGFNHSENSSRENYVDQTIDNTQNNRENFSEVTQIAQESQNSGPVANLERNGIGTGSTNSHFTYRDRIVAPSIDFSDENLLSERRNRAFVENTNSTIFEMISNNLTDEENRSIEIMQSESRRLSEDNIQVFAEIVSQMSTDMSSEDQLNGADDINEHITQEQNIPYLTDSRGNLNEQSNSGYTRNNIFGVSDINETNFIDFLVSQIELDRSERQETSELRRHISRSFPLVTSSSVLAPRLDNYRFRDLFYQRINSERNTQRANANQLRRNLLLNQLRRSFSLRNDDSVNRAQLLAFIQNNRDLITANMHNNPLNRRRLTIRPRYPFQSSVYENLDSLSDPSLITALMPNNFTQDTEARELQNSDEHTTESSLENNAQSENLEGQESNQDPNNYVIRFSTNNGVTSRILSRRSGLLSNPTPMQTRNGTSNRTSENIEPVTIDYHRVRDRRVEVHGMFNRDGEFDEFVNSELELIKIDKSIENKFDLEDILDIGDKDIIPEETSSSENDSENSKKLEAVQLEKVCVFNESKPDFLDNLEEYTRFFNEVDVVSGPNNSNLSNSTNNDQENVIVDEPLLKVEIDTCESLDLCYNDSRDQIHIKKSFNQKEKTCTNKEMQTIQFDGLHFSRKNNSFEKYLLEDSLCTSLIQTDMTESYSILNFDETSKHSNESLDLNYQKESEKSNFNPNYKKQSEMEPERENIYRNLKKKSKMEPQRNNINLNYKKESKIEPKNDNIHLKYKNGSKIELEKDNIHLKCKKGSKIETEKDNSDFNSDSVKTSDNFKGEMTNCQNSINLNYISNNFRDVKNIQEKSFINSRICDESTFKNCNQNVNTRIEIENNPKIEKSDATPLDSCKISKYTENVQDNKNASLFLQSSTNIDDTLFKGKKISEVKSQNDSTPGKFNDFQSQTQEDTSKRVLARRRNRFVNVCKKTQTLLDKISTLKEKLEIQENAYHEKNSILIHKKTDLASNYNDSANSKETYLLSSKNPILYKKNVIPLKKNFQYGLDEKEPFQKNKNNAAELFLSKHDEFCSIFDFRNTKNNCFKKIDPISLFERICSRSKNLFSKRKNNRIKDSIFAFLSWTLFYSLTIDFEIFYFSHIYSLLNHIKLKRKNYQMISNTLKKLPLDIINGAKKHLSPLQAIFHKFIYLTLNIEQLLNYIDKSKKGHREHLLKTICRYIRANTALDEKETYKILSKLCLYIKVDDYVVATLSKICYNNIKYQEVLLNLKIIKKLDLVMREKVINGNEVTNHVFLLASLSSKSENVRKEIIKYKLHTLVLKKIHKKIQNKKIDGELLSCLMFLKSMTRSVRFMRTELIKINIISQLILLLTWIKALKRSRRSSLKNCFKINLDLGSDFYRFKIVQEVFGILSNFALEFVSFKFNFLKKGGLKAVFNLGKRRGLEHDFIFFLKNFVFDTPWSHKKRLLPFLFRNNLESKLEKKCEKCLQFVKINTHIEKNVHWFQNFKCCKCLKSLDLLKTQFETCQFSEKSTKFTKKNLNLNNKKLSVKTNQSECNYKNYDSRKINNLQNDFENLQKEKENFSDKNLHENYQQKPKKQIKTSDDDDNASVYKNCEEGLKQKIETNNENNISSIYINSEEGLKQKTEINNENNISSIYINSEEGYKQKIEINNENNVPSIYINCKEEPIIKKYDQENHLSLSNELSMFELDKESTRKKSSSDLINVNDDLRIVSEEHISRNIQNNFQSTNYKDFNINSEKGCSKLVDSYEKEDFSSEFLNFLNLYEMDVNETEKSNSHSSLSHNKIYQFLNDSHKSKCHCVRSIYLQYIFLFQSSYDTDQNIDSNEKNLLERTENMVFSRILKDAFKNTPIYFPKSSYGILSNLIKHLNKKNYSRSTSRSKKNLATLSEIIKFLRNLICINANEKFTYCHNLIFCLLNIIGFLPKLLGGISFSKKSKVIAHIIYLLVNATASISNISEILFSKKIYEYLKLAVMLDNHAINTAVCLFILNKSKSINTPQDKIAIDTLNQLSNERWGIKLKNKTELKTYILKLLKLQEEKLQYS